MIDLILPDFIIIYIIIMFIFTWGIIVCKGINRIRSVVFLFQVIVIESASLVVWPCIFIIIVVVVVEVLFLLKFW